VYSNLAGEEHADLGGEEHADAEPSNAIRLTLVLVG
jgi:hypothetical protein